MTCGCCYVCTAHVVVLLCVYCTCVAVCVLHMLLCCPVCAAHVVVLPCAEPQGVADAAEVFRDGAADEAEFFRFQGHQKQSYQGEDILSLPSAVTSA